MRLSGILVVGLLNLVTPGLWGREGPPNDDPLAEVIAALDQGRHWYAARLLRNLEANSASALEATLLAARADAGRDAWESVVQRLSGVAWLDSIGAGEGRHLLARAQLETGQLDLAVANYRQFLGYSIERMPRALAEVGLARGYAELGLAREAAAAFERAAEALPELQPWSSIRAAESLATLGDTTAVRDLLARAPGVPFYRRTLAEVAAYEATGNRQRAIGILLDAASSPAARRRSADLRTRAARLHLESGDTAAARGTLRTAIRVQPSGAREAAEILAQFSDLSASDHKALGLAFERSRAYALAADHYRQYLDLETVAEGDRVDLELKIGELLFRGGSYFSAVQQLEKVIAIDPPLHLKAKAEYVAARATYRRGWRRDGRRRLREIADRYPGTSSAINSLSLLGDLYESAGNVAEARAIYVEISTDYPGSRVTPGVRYRLGIVSFLRGDYSEAREYFDRLRRSSRWNEIRIQATYWAARARLAEGTPERVAEAEGLLRSVQAHDPFGYYGFLAAERLDIDPWAGLSPGPRPIPIQQETRDRFALIAILQHAGLDEEANAVLETIVDAGLRRPEEMLGLSEALAKRGFGQEAVRLGWQAHARLRGVWTESVLRAVYPLAFTEIINAEASSRHLDPFLVAAIARQESAFDPGVISRAGARGLLQLMPATGRWWAGRLGIRDYNIDQLFHPETNVHLGTAYFADLQRRYGELQIALVAYNAGPTRARRWRQRPEYADPELFAERIPLSETRSYVRNVQSHYRIYSHIYGDLRAARPAD